MISLSDKNENIDIIEANEDASSKNEVFSQQSDISSLNESFVGTDGGRILIMMS